MNPILDDKAAAASKNKVEIYAEMLLFMGRLVSSVGIFHNFPTRNHLLIGENDLDSKCVVQNYIPEDFCEEQIQSS